MNAPHMGPVKPDPTLLELAESSGAKITGKPDGSEPIEIVFSIRAWRAFDAALQQGLYSVAYRSAS